MKSVAEGSAAAVDGRLRVNDQIIEVRHYALLLKQMFLFFTAVALVTAVPCSMMIFS